MDDDVRKLQGTWRQVAYEVDGVRSVAGVSDSGTITTFIGNTYAVAESDGHVFIKGVFTLDPTRVPKAVDWTDTFGEDEGKTFPAIYSLEGDQLMFCVSDEGEKRPTEFRTGLGQVLRILRREES